MIFNLAGLKLIQDFEGCKLSSYQDQRGRWTIGWGATGPDVGPSMSWTQEQADERLNQDIESHSKLVTGLLVNQTLNANQFSAILSFEYNLGYENLKQSTLLNCINTYHCEDAANEFEKWDHCDGVEDPGLLRRRLAEKALFLTTV
jgi:lysozyme